MQEHFVAIGSGSLYPISRERIMPGNEDSGELSRTARPPDETNRGGIVRPDTAPNTPKPNPFTDRIKDLLKNRDVIRSPWSFPTHTDMRANKDIAENAIDYADGLLAAKVTIAVREGRDTTLSEGEFTRLKGVLQKAGISDADIAGMSEAEVVAALPQAQSRLFIKPSEDKDFNSPSGTGDRKAQEDFNRVQMESARSDDEKALEPEEVGKLLTVDKDVKEIIKGDNLGAAAGGPPDWADLLPDVAKVGKELRKYISDLNEISGLIGADFERGVHEFNKLRNDYEQRRWHNELGKKNKDIESVWDVMRLAQAEIALRAEAELAKKAGSKDEIEESQYIFYGLTTMPKIKNLGKEPDKLKHQLGEADELVIGFKDSGDITDDDIKALRKLSVDDLARFKENGSTAVRKAGLISGDADIQKKIYEALKRDQEIWLHEKIESLPWENLDVSRVQNNLAYREFQNAQIDMLPEVAEYSRVISHGSELKYAFTKNGMEALVSNASNLKETFEELSEKVYGWNDVVSEIETFVTRQELLFEGQVQGWREKFDVRFKVLTKDFIEDFKINKGRLPTAKELAEQHEGFRSTIRGEMISASGDEHVHDKMQQAAVGLYVYKENEDGSVERMKPKRKKEIEIDQKILGEDEDWKVGGFVRFKSLEDVGKMREHLVDFAQQKLEEMLGTEEGKDKFTKEQIKARAKIAAFMGEWLYWRMTGRSAYWGEQGGSKSPAGGGYGETQMFYVVGFQQFITQEGKGNGETGRVMRKLAVGADTVDEYLENFVPGEAGGANMNTGLWDLYSQYSAILPGERAVKPIQGERNLVTGEMDLLFVRSMGKDQGKRIERIMRDADRKINTLLDSGIGNDQAWEIVRNEMSDEDKNYLEEYNNRPIVTLASRSSRKGLESIAKGNGPWLDAPDFYGDDFKGADATKSILAIHDDGFLSNPQSEMLGAVAKNSVGRKRVWQRAKQMKDMAVTLLEFKSIFNKKIWGKDNWNADRGDEFLTDIKKQGLIVERKQKEIEKIYYRRIVEKGLARLIPFADNPLVHKLAFNYSKRPFRIIYEMLLAMFAEFAKRLPSQIAQGTQR